MPSWPLLFAVGVFALALWAQGDALVGVFYDDGIYVTGAKALAEGAGYRNIHLPGAPPIVHYPVLYSLVLSVLWRVWPVFPANVALFRLANAVLMAGSAWMVASHASRLAMPGWVRWLAMAAGFTTFPLLTIIQLQLSEPLFLVLVAAAIALADRDEAGTSAAFAAGVLAGLAVLTKSVGVSVMLGVPVGFWMRGRRAAALLSFGAAVLIALPWTLWVAVHAPHIDPRLANYTTYFDEARQAGLRSILDGLKLRALAPITFLTLPRWPPWGVSVLGALMLASLAWGGVVSARRAPALVVTVALYFLIVSLWPFPPHRFVWIVMPWLALLIGAGCVKAWRRGPVTRAGAAVLLLAVTYGYLPREGASIAHAGFATASADISRSFRVLIPSIAAEIPADAVVASEDEALVYLYTGRRSVPSHLFRWAGLGTEPLPEDQRLRYWCETGVTHLAVTAPADPAAQIVAHLVGRPDSTFTRLFQVTNGPGLYRFRCPR